MLNLNIYNTFLTVSFIYYKQLKITQIQAKNPTNWAFKIESFHNTSERSLSREGKAKYEK